MDDHEALKIHRRARLSAIAHGPSEHAADIAQDVVLKFLVKNRKGQTIDQAVIDAMRHRFGDMRQKNFALKNSLLVASHEDNSTEAKNYESAEVRLEIVQAINVMLGRLDRYQRTCLVLEAVWDFRHDEIAAVVGVTPSAVTHVLIKAKATLRRLYKAQS